jgi:hypothetical protein
VIAEIYEAPSFPPKFSIAAPSGQTELLELPVDARNRQRYSEMPAHRHHMSAQCPQIRSRTSCACDAGQKWLGIIEATDADLQLPSIRTKTPLVAAAGRRYRLQKLERRQRCLGNIGRNGRSRVVACPCRTNAGAGYRESALSQRHCSAPPYLCRRRLVWRRHGAGLQTPRRRSA